MAKTPLLIIAGPTACGKSDVAVETALRLDTEVVSADSMQVYRHMDIGTAKLPPEERKGVDHHMLDVVNPDEEFSLAMYKRMAQKKCLDIAGRGKTPVVAGGTGLYIKALSENYPLEELPFDSQCRAELENQWQELGGGAMHKLLEQADPQAAQRINLGDKRRIIRALEIYRLTGVAPTNIQQKARQNNPFSPLLVVLELPRRELYRRINSRAHSMLDAGLLDEYNKLLDMGFSPQCNAMQGLGYRHCYMHVQGFWDKEEMLAMLQRDTRRYAKRQLTWFRGQKNAIWLDNSTPDSTPARICSILQGYEPRGAK